MSDGCWLCENVSDEQLVTVAAKGRTKIIEASRQRDDGRHHDLQNLQPLLVHTSCRKEYTRQTSILSFLKTQTRLEASATADAAREEPYAGRPAGPRLRSTESSFDIYTDCIHCGLKAIDTNKRGSDRVADKVYTCQSIPYIEKIKVQCNVRNYDQCSEDVLFRIALISDFVAGEVRYHNRCRVNFFRNKKPRCEQTLDKQVAFIRLCNFLKDNSECQYSISELECVMADNMCNGVSSYTRKHLQNKLRDHFRESLIVTSLPGKPNILTFRKTFCEIIHASWYDDKAIEEHTEKIRLTSAVAELVASDIRAMPCEVNTYPSPRSLNMAGLQESVPQSLHFLIEGITA